MKLSIVIATYNAASTLQRCLDSIANQTFKDFEVLIIDGLSKDETVPIISNNSKSISYWQSKKDLGIYDAWNQGIANAKGEYISFIGADDFFSSPVSLQTIFESVESNKFDLVLFQGIFVKSKSEKKYIIGSDWNYNELIKMPICHPGMLHHKSLFERFGKFNTEFRIAGDYDFMLRLPADIKSLYIESPLITIMDGGASRSQYMLHMKEKKTIRSRNPRIGKLMANFHYYNKMWRIPIAKILNIPY